MILALKFFYTSNYSLVPPALRSMPRKLLSSDVMFTLIDECTFVW